MNYNVLSKVSEVDSLLTFTTDKKEDLDFRRIVLNREKKRNERYCNRYRYRVGKSQRLDNRLKCHFECHNR
jgi:hypothetical protein